jgi:regulator of sigma E protease
MVERGLLLDVDMRMEKADGLLDAVALGFRESWQRIGDIYQSLTRLLSGRISPKMLGGPLQIASAAFNVAGEDLYKYLFFLGFISVNLAVVNFLPIPVLDGGHMVFLIYEGIVGRPPSEWVRTVATYLGLLFILLLMLFVVAVDLKRFYPWLPLPL